MEKFIVEPRYIPVDFDPFGSTEILETIPTTEAQQEVMLAAGLSNEASCAYIESVSLELSGPLDHEALKAAMDRLVARHGSLRSTLSPTGTRMMVWAHRPFDLNVVDLSGLNAGDRGHRLRAIAEQDMTTAFDLQNGPLFRALLIKTGVSDHLLRLTGHHAVCDGWSLGIMMAEISALYNAALHGGPDGLPTPGSFSEYALATLDLADSPEHAAVEAYWSNLYKTPVATLDLPTDRPRPRQKTFNGDRLDLDLSPELVTNLRTVATRTGASFVTTLLTTFELFIHKLTGEPDMVVGLPAAGQSDLGMKHLVGHCVNLLALRSWIDEDQPFIDHLKQRRTAVLDAFDNQKYTFGTLLKKLSLPRVPGRIPLCPVVFNIDMNMDDGVAFAGLRHRFISNPRRYENFELFLNATGKADHLTLEWSYNTDLFDEATVKEWMKDFSALIQRVTTRPEARIGDLIGTEDLSLAGTLPPVEWYGAAVPYPRNKSVSVLFDEIVQEHGTRTALVHGDRRLTYARLSEQVMKLSAALINAGVRSGDLVGLCTERHMGMVVAQLAIMRVGAAFVPIDHTYPEDRLKFIFDDARFPVLIVDPALSEGLPAHTARTIVLEPALYEGPAVGTVAPLDGPGHAAYIMYTSGSTGRPKGVVVPQRGIVRLVRNQNYAPLGPDAVITQLSNISFDASTFELWGALLNGGKLVLQQQAKPSMREITDTMERHGVNILFITTGLFNVLVDEQVDRLKGLKCILTGGEAMSVPHITKALRVIGPGVLHNIYGPTENTTYSSFHPINSEADIGRSVPIGKAINNTFLYVLNEEKQPVAVGVKGELYTGGDGVALGYWDRPDLTAERFLPDPFLGGDARMYRTGDLVRWNANGSIEFLGRADDQVKVRGFRIELGEIENAISEVPGIRDRVVMARKDVPGDHQLVAYVVPSDFDPNADRKRSEALITTLKGHLAGRLPNYMLPSFHVLLPDLPLNPNGKVDKKKLPVPDMRATQMTVEHVAPRNETERQLASIWTKVLGVEDIGVHVSFFDLGGHSILGIQVLTQIEQQFGRTYGLNLLFRSPTIAELATELRGEQRHDPSQDLRNISPIKTDGDRVPLICVHGDEANHFLPRYLSSRQPFYGYVHQGEDGKPIMHTSVETIAAHYIAELKALVPKGPYTLCGYSFGGMVAYEMGRQLLAAGENVPLLILLDTYAPEPFVHVMNDERKFYEPVKKAVMRSLIGLHRALNRPLPAKLRNFHIIDTYDEAILAYRTKPYPGRVAVIKALGSPGPQDMGWRKHVTGDLVLRNCEGDHYSIIKEPLVGQLASVMENLLEPRVPGSAAV